MTQSSPSSPAANTNRYAAASAICDHLDTRTAAVELADALHDDIGGKCDLLLCFASYHHRAALGPAVQSMRSVLTPHTTLAVTAEAVLGADQELDGRPGFSALAMRLGDARLHTWTTTPQNPIRLDDPSLPPEEQQRRHEERRKRIGVADDFRAMFFTGDPFSVPIARLLPALSSCGGEQPVLIVGGMASGATQPGLNVIVLDDEILPAGGAGVTISGDVQIDCVVSQGCRPIGQPFVVTKVRDNVILELGSRKAMEALQDMAGGLSGGEKRLLSSGLLIGTVINEYKSRFGRGDFLVRNILGFDQQHGGIGVGDVPRVGQTIQFHVRDAKTAAEDLDLLLTAQQFDDKPPFGAVLFSCNGRGERLFGVPNHDLDMIHRRLNNVPTAGFFAAGEIGPIGETSFLHGHTASLALFRAP